MSRAKNIGNLYAELSVRDKMTLGLNKAKKSLTAFARKSAGLAKSGSKYAAIGAAGTAVALAAGTKGAISMVDAIGDMSAQTGVGVAALMKLQQAYKDGGGDAERAGKDIAKMQKTIGDVATGISTVNPFKDIGMDVKELINLSPDEQFKKIGDRIMQIENPTLRNAKAMEIFGKSGTKLITVFAGMEASATKLGKMPELAAKFVGAMDEANDIFGRLNTKKDQFFVGFASGIIGELLPNLQKVDGFDFTELGQNLGKNIALGFRGLTDGTLLEIAGLKMNAWILGVGADILDMLNGLISPIVAFIGAAFEKLKDTAANAWADIKFGLTGDAEEHDRQMEGRKYQRTFDQSYNDRDNSNDKIDRQIIDEMNFLADEGWNKLTKEVNNGLAEAAAITVPMRQSGDDVEFANMAQKTASSSAEYIQSEVNSMQARGLGMGRENVSSKVDQQIDILKEIAKLIKDQSKLKTSSVF